MSRDIEINDSIIRKNAGWVVIGKKKRVFDDESVVYNARVVSGIPRPGMTLTQVKRTSTDIILSSSKSLLKLFCKSDTLLSYDDNERVGFGFGGMVIRLYQDTSIVDADFSGLPMDIFGGLKAKIALTPTLSLCCSCLYVFAPDEGKFLSWDPDEKTDDEYVEAQHKGLSIKRNGFRLEAAIHIK